MKKFHQPCKWTSAYNASYPLTELSGGFILSLSFISLIFNGEKTYVLKKGKNSDICL